MSETDLLEILDEYGDHKLDCHKVTSNENDCSCGWGDIRTCLNELRRRYP